MSTHPTTMSPLSLRPRLQSADFQQALGSRPVARSAHFTVHVAEPSLLPKKPRVVLEEATAAELSTGDEGEVVVAVDDFVSEHRVWRLGLVLPKRMAKRSVTRSLIKHQARELWRLHAPALEAAGWLGPQRPVLNWVLRMKAPWPKAEFPSAASAPLKALVRQELLSIMVRLAKPEHVAMPGPREARS